LLPKNVERTPSSSRRFCGIALCKSPAPLAHPRNNVSNVPYGRIQQSLIKSADTWMPKREASQSRTEELRMTSLRCYRKVRRILRISLEDDFDNILILLERVVTRNGRVTPRIVRTKLEHEVFVADDCRWRVVQENGTDGREEREVILCFQEGQPKVWAFTQIRKLLVQNSIQTVIPVLDQSKRFRDLAVGVATLAFPFVFRRFEGLHFVSLALQLGVVRLCGFFTHDRRACAGFRRCVEQTKQ